MKTVKKLVLMSVVFYVSFVLFIGQYGYADDVRGVTADTIKVGLLCDQTGPIADITLPLSEGVRNYTRYINDQGGIHGRKLKLIVEDDRYSIPVTLAAFKKLLFKDRILALIGPGSLGGGRTLIKQIEKLKLPTIAPLADRILIDPYRRYIFLPVGFYDDEIGVFFEYILKDLKSKDPKICLASIDVESGKVVKEHTKAWADFFGLKLHIEILPMGGLEAVSQVMSMKRSGVTHVIIHHTSQGAILLLREQRKFGLNIPIFGTSPTCAEETVRIAGKASKNYIGAHLYSSWYDETPGMANLRKITIGYHPGTEKPPRSKQYTGGWVAATILYEGMKRAGKNLNAETLVDSIETIRDFDTKGLCGPITYTSNNHRGLYHCKLFKADPPTGRFLPITDWRRPPAKE